MLNPPNALCLVEAEDCSFESADADALADVEARLIMLTPVAVGEDFEEPMLISVGMGNVV